MDDLSDDALRGVVEEFVTRDGMEFTDGARKVARVLELLELGKMEIWFDESSRTCTIRASDER